MICKKCGAEVNDNVRFCNKCGEDLSAYTENIQQPGEAPVPPPYVEGQGQVPPFNAADPTGFGENPASSGIMNKKPLLFGIVGAAAIVLIILLIVLFSGGGAEDTVKDYYKAIQKEDPKKFVSMMPKNIMKDLEEEAGVDKDDVIDCVEDYIDDTYDKDYYDSMEDLYEDYKEGDKIKVTVLDTVKLDKDSDEYDDIIDEIEDTFDIYEDYIDDMKFSEFDTKDISGISYIDYKIISDTSRVMRSVAFKYKGDWYNYEVVTDILSAVEEYN